MIKRILLILSLIPGFLVILIAAVSKRLTSHFDSESINILMNYVSEFDGNMEGLASSEAGVMFAMYKINEYSHWIITGAIIWIVVILFILISLRRTKSEEE